MTRAAWIASLVMVARVASADPSEAERLYTEGQKAYEDKRYDDALVAWQKSYELSKLPGLVFNIAQAHRLKGECTKAVASYRTFIELDPGSGQRGQAENLVKELEPCKDAPAPVVERHDPPIVERHDVPQVVAATRRSYPRPVTPEPRGRGKLVASAIIGVAGAAAAGVGLLFGGQADSLATEVKAACASGCAWTDIKDRDAEGHRDVVLQWSLIGAGAAALVASGVLYYLAASERSSASTVVVAPRPSGATVSWQRSW